MMKNPPKRNRKDRYLKQTKNHRRILDPFELYFEGRFLLEKTTFYPASGFVVSATLGKVIGNLFGDDVFFPEFTTRPIILLVRKMNAISTSW